MIWEKEIQRENDILTFTDFDYKYSIKLDY